MELLIFLAIVCYATKIGAEDLLFAVRGKPSPRQAARLARANGRPTPRGGAFGRYMLDLWNDAWDVAGDRHRQRHERRQQVRQSKLPKQKRPAGPARTYMTNRVAEVKAGMKRRWGATWERAEARHQRRYERRHPTATEATATPADEERCPCGGQFRRVDGTEYYDADGTAMVDTRCERCGMESAHYFAWDPPEDWDTDDPQDPEIPKADTEASGTTTPDTGGDNNMSTTHGEVTGLRSAITYSEELASGADEAVTALEALSASLTAGGTGQGTVGKFTAAGEHLAAAAAALRDAAGELGKHLPVTEAYEATGNEAGEKAFVTAD